MQFKYFQIFMDNNDQKLSQQATKRKQYQFKQQSQVVSIKQNSPLIIKNTSNSQQEQQVKKRKEKIANNSALQANSVQLANQLQNKQKPEIEYEKIEQLNQIVYKSDKQSNFKKQPQILQKIQIDQVYKQKSNNQILNVNSQHQHLHYQMSQPQIHHRSNTKEIAQSYHSQESQLYQHPEYLQIKQSSQEQEFIIITNSIGGLKNNSEDIIQEQHNFKGSEQKIFLNEKKTRNKSNTLNQILDQKQQKQNLTVQKTFKEYFTKDQILSYIINEKYNQGQLENSLRILNMKANKQMIGLQGITLYAAGPYKNQLHQFVLKKQSNIHDNLLYSIIQLTKINHTQNTLNQKNSFNKWVFSIMQPTIYLQKWFQQNQNLNLFTKFDVIQSQYGNIQIGIVEETAMSQYFNSLSNFRIGLHLRNGQIFDNADILTNKNNHNGWRNPKKEYSPPIFKDLTVKVGLQKDRKQGIYTVMWTLNQGKQSEWSQTSIINQKIIKQGLNFYLGFFHQNDKILINKNLQKTGTNGKRVRQLTSNQQQKNDQHPVSKKSLKQEIQTHKRQDQSQQILSSKKQEKSYENYQQKIVLEQLNNYYDLLKEDNQTKLDKIYAKKEQEIIQHLIKCLVSKRQQFISVSQKFLDLRLSVLDGPNSKLKQYLKVDIKKAQVNKSDFNEKFLYPQISITKLQSKEATNKWIFYLLGSSINFEIIKDTGQILRTTFYIQKSQHSNIQMGIVGRRANADYFNSLSNKRLGFHLRNCQVYDNLQEQMLSKWRQPKSPNKPSFDKITNGIQIKLEISYTAIKGYEIKWKVDDWFQTSTINQKLISEGINFFVNLFHSNDTIIVNKTTQKTV